VFVKIWLTAILNFANRQQHFLCFEERFVKTVLTSKTVKPMSRLFIWCLMSSISGCWHATVGYFRNIGLRSIWYFWIITWNASARSLASCLEIPGGLVFPNFEKKCFKLFFDAHNHGWTTHDICSGRLFSSFLQRIYLMALKCWTNMMSLSSGGSRQWRANGGRTGRRPRASKAGGHPKSEITKF